jgi:hypothetical protein
MKTNVLLALLEQGNSVFKALVSDYTGFFKRNQGDFKGVRKTYTARPDTMDEPSMRGANSVVTTVEEKLQWFKDNASGYLDQRLAMEATNASGNARADLIIDGKIIANLSSSELLSLKNFLENKEVMQMYSNIPVRSDAEIWTKSTAEEYLTRDVYEQPLMSGIKKSITKEQYILEDPNISKMKNTDSYKPVIATKDTPLELGDWTSQLFSGEWTHNKRANLLKRKNTLYLAVIEALKKANEVEVVKSTITADSIFNYLHNGEF